MTKYQKRHRIIATFFLLIFFPTLLPNNLFASTNGPVAPEATSFEPVDATDMVNLATGDLSYVMPLLDIPSPEGGYPLTLSYHAGIAIDQDASWVGLGWSLNPGAINRSISGFPDDWKEENTSSIVFDSGGEISTHNFGVGVGWGEGKYSVGLYGSYSENKAFGGKNSYNFDGGIGFEASASFSLKKEDIKENSTGSSLQTLSENNGSVGISSVNYFGSNGNNSNRSSSNYTTRQVGDRVGINLNIYLFKINYSFSKLRYHYFDTKKTSGIGSLYPENISNAINNAISFATVGFDTYTANYDQTDESLLGNNIVLPTYDFYSVSGQGISGDISPKIFEYGTLVGKTESVYIEGKRFVSNYYNKNSFTKTLDSNNLHFYFNNSNESYLNIDSDVWGTTPASMGSFFADFNSPSSTMNTTLTIDGVNVNGYNTVNKRKKGGSYIETYTNQQIISNPNLIYNLSNFNRSSPSVPKDGIGAFKITTSDGKTYHYSIPVYQKEKFARSSKYDEDINNKFYEEFQLAPYATHWLLSAITGPDFVDDGDGTITDKDLGYWVTFDYGKWSDGYTWRTPRGTDFKTTPTSKMYEWGIKEIYYLNAVKTRTHTALFVKSERTDGKSIPETLDREFSKYGDARSFSTWNNKDNLWYLNVLGTFPGINYYANQDASHKVKMNYKKEEHNLLKLDKIIVVKNKDIPENFKYSNPNEISSKIKSSINITESAGVGHGGGIDKEIKNSPVYSSVWSGEYYNNILDANDINYYFPNIQNYSNKIIDFSYDYSLAKGTPNGASSIYGRLTLNKLIYKGKNGNQVLPPYIFEYENPNQVYNNNNCDDWGYNKGATASWNLNKIIHPNGANIIVKYEEDDYFTEAVNYETRFKSELKFSFSENLGKLRIIVENLDPNNSNKINFSSFYNINQQAKVNIWACIKHEYNNGGCSSRDGSVNIDNENVDVVAVSDTSVTFETTLTGHTSDSNSGLGWLYDTQYYYNMDRLQVKERNQCPELTGGCSSRTAYTLFYTINSNKISKDQNGGGLRVKQITVNADGKNYNTNYYYNQDGFGKNKTDSNYKSSGITSYSPSKYEKNIKYMAELPPPGVIYNTVRVETDLEINKYYFKTLTPEIENSQEYSIGDILNIKKVQNQNNIPITVPYHSNPTLTKYKYEVKNHFGMIGALIKQEKYNKSNQLLRKVENNYTPSTNILQGLVKETFNSYKNSWTLNTSINKYEGTFDLNVSSKTTYPSVIKSTTISENGFSNTVVYNKFDFLTGQVLETSTVSSNGQSYKTKIIPAYFKYTEMGSKADNVTYKNMLSQIAANYSYILKNGIWKETGVGITTWSNVWEYNDISGNIIPATVSKEKIWRKHKSYIWNGPKDADGIATGYVSTNNTDDGFIWDLPIGVGVNVAQPAQWKQISETTSYDHFSSPLEMKDINGNYTSSKKGDNDSKIITTGNARYGEMFFAGAENAPLSNFPTFLEQEVVISSASRSPTIYHTGKYSVATTSSSQFGVAIKNTQHKAGKYKISVWVEKTNAAKAQLKVNGAVVNFITNSVTAGNWILKTAYINVPSGNCTVYLNSNDTTTVYFDDLMLRPVASTITGYVYNEWDELTYIIGNNGLATKFEYDAAGRLIKTYSEVIDNSGNQIVGGFKLAKSNLYNNRYFN